MKANRKVKVYRAGLVDPTPVPSLKLGSIDDILSNKNNILYPVDKYTLKRFEGDGEMLLCDVFLVSDEAGAQASDNSQERAAAAAAEKAEEKAVKARSKYKTEPELLACLRQTFDGRGIEWPNAVTVRVVRDRFVAVEVAVKKAHEMGWNRSTGGYAIPLTYTVEGHPEYNELRGREFTKEALQEAVHVLHAAAGTDRQAMSKDLLDNCPQASAWFDNPDDEKLGRKFNTMKTVDFKRRLERKREEAKVKKAKERKQSKAEGKRRKVDSDADDSADASEEEGAPPKKKSKAKKSGYQSSDLDRD
ncbi:hypothetical protein FB451DRAFT_1395030 [Mycena latifolia]|nr:hypothetical protein FB451DRAFT_1395030 [Mycena latifolia]